jgi:beta-lactam-binding protein with PASTA domain
VTLVVSLGPELLPLPLVEGMTLEEAKTAIEEAGFQVGAVKVQTGNAPENTVVRQQPAWSEEAAAERGSHINLWIVRKEGLVRDIVPNMLGMERDAALAYLESLGLVGTVAGEEPSDIYAMGLVTRQSPDADSPLDEENGIFLWISSGLAPQWTYEYSASIQVEEDDTRVVIWFDEGGPDAARIYDEVLDNGSYGPILLNAVATQDGEKRITIYNNGELVREETLLPREEEE